MELQKMQASQGSEENKQAQDVDVVRYSNYNLRPTLKERFPVNSARELLATVIANELLGRTYVAAESMQLTSHIADIIKSRLLDTGMQRNSYKIIVFVTLGEVRGEGILICSRALWDADTDVEVSHLFHNGSLFCNVVVYAIFVY